MQSRKRASELLSVRIQRAHEVGKVQTLVFFFGRQVFETLENVLLPRRAAVLLFLFGRSRSVIVSCRAPEQIEHEVRVHGRKAGVLLGHDGVGDVELESLETAKGVSSEGIEIARGELTP